MNYTKAQRKAIAEAFAAAKRRLWDGVSRRRNHKTKFICHALDLVGNYHTVGPTANARDVVMARIGDSFTMKCWLRDRGIPDCLLRDCLVQRHRHAWLDKLIEEFST